MGYLSEFGRHMTNGMGVYKGSPKTLGALGHAPLGWGEVLPNMCYLPNLVARTVWGYLGVHKIGIAGLSFEFGACLTPLRLPIMIHGNCAAISCRFRVNRQHL